MADPNSPFFDMAFQGEQEPLLAAVYLDPGLLIVRCGLMADVNVGNVSIYGRSTLFHAACAGGHLNLAKVLEQRGSDLHALGNFNTNALMYAFQYGRREVADWLLERGIDLHAVTGGNQRTALHYAACNDHPELACFSYPEVQT